MPDAKGVSKKSQTHNHLVRAKSRKKMEDKLTSKFNGDRDKAKKEMAGKHVHKTDGGYLKLLSPSEHGKKHGRGNKGRPRAYKRK